MTAASARAYACSCCAGRRGANVRLTEAEYEALCAAGMVRLFAVEHLPADLAGRPLIARGPGWVALGRKRRTRGPAGPAAREPKQAISPPRRSQPQRSPAAQEIRACPSCKRETVVSDAGTCLWCGTRLDLADLDVEAA